MKLRSLIRLLFLLSADFAAITLTWPDFGRLGHELAAPHDSVRREGADVVAAHLAACGVCCVLCWLAIGLTAALFAGLPGAVGATARRTSRIVLPATLRRFVAGAAGIGVLVAPVSALAGTAATDAPATVTTARGAPAPLPSPLLPSNGPAAPAQLAAPVLPADVGPAPSADHGNSVVVRPGDSLWRIAERGLGANATPAATATAWPSWYGANRAVIGDNPALLTPGEVLHAPAGVSR